ncbi:MAG: TIGR03943 family protein [Leptolyngbyaceae cyanobacterium SM1_3_5]|nr:TIGR03943 family protein [Leptolyngbyaceae cyanobacterium SM1_3_5]
MVDHSAASPSRRPKEPKPLRQIWLDVLATVAWGAVLLRFWLAGKMPLLLHPNYVWLAVAAGFALLGLGAWKARQGWIMQHRRSRFVVPNPQHFNLLPPRLSSLLLLVVALVGLGFTPRPFASDVALNRGVTETLMMTRAQPQSFRATVNPEDRSIIDWIRTLSVYPEPDAYSGQTVNVKGFVIHPPNLPEGYFVISRFVITCCAADAYPVGLPVKIEGSRSQYPADSWQQVRGNMITETLDNQRQLVIQASEIKAVPQPRNPYAY